MKPSAIPQVYAETIENGGGTFRHNGQQATRGFAVGIIEGSFAVVDIDDRLAFEDAINQVSLRFPLGTYIGTWVHEGRIHIDPVRVVQREADARSLAETHNQLAYFNLNTMNEVML